MRASSVLLLAGLAATVLGQDDGHDIKSLRFHDLTESNFEHIVVSPKGKLMNIPWLVMFYAPWCGHCKRLMPIMDDFAEQYGDGERLHVGRVNCDDHKQICTAYDVSGYPTIAYLHGDYFYEFKGPRTAENLKNFVFNGEYEQAESERLP